MSAGQTASSEQTALPTAMLPPSLPPSDLIADAKHTQKERAELVGAESASGSDSEQEDPALGPSLMAEDTPLLGVQMT